MMKQKVLDQYLHLTQYTMKQKVLDQHLWPHPLDATAKKLKWQSISNQQF